MVILIKDARTSWALLRRISNKHTACFHPRVTGLFINAYTYCGYIHKHTYNINVFVRHKCAVLSESYISIYYYYYSSLLPSCTRAFIPPNIHSTHTTRSARENARGGVRMCFGCRVAIARALLVNCLCIRVFYHASQARACGPAFVTHLPHMPTNTIVKPPSTHSERLLQYAPYI